MVWQIFARVLNYLCQPDNQQPPPPPPPFSSPFSFSYINYFPPRVQPSFVSLLPAVFYFIYSNPLFFLHIYSFNLRYICTHEHPIPHWVRVKMQTAFAMCTKVLVHFFFMLPIFFSVNRYDKVFGTIFKHLEVTYLSLFLYLFFINISFYFFKLITNKSSNSNWNNIKL